MFETGGKQYKAGKGDMLEVEHLDLKPESTIVFDKVLLLNSEDTVEIGTPYLGNVRINARVIDSVKGDKIVVQKFRAKSRYRRKYGHRTLFSKIKIEDITRENIT